MLCKPAGHFLLTLQIQMLFIPEITGRIDSDFLHTRNRIVISKIVLARIICDSVVDGLVFFRREPGRGIQDQQDGSIK